MTDQSAPDFAAAVTLVQETPHERTHRQEMLAMLLDNFEVFGDVTDLELDAFLPKTELQRVAMTNALGLRRATIEEYCIFAIKFVQRGGQWHDSPSDFDTMGLLFAERDAFLPCGLGVLAIHVLARPGTVITRHEGDDHSITHYMDGAAQNCVFNRITIYNDMKPLLQTMIQRVFGPEPR